MGSAAHSSSTGHRGFYLSAYVSYTITYDLQHITGSVFYHLRTNMAPTHRRKACLAWAKSEPLTMARDACTGRRPCRLHSTCPKSLRQHNFFEMPQNMFRELKTSAKLSIASVGVTIEGYFEKGADDAFNLRDSGHHQAIRG